MFTLLLTASKLSFTPISSWPLIVGTAVLLALLSIYFYSRVRGDFSAGKRRLLTALRIMAFMCLILVLLQPAINIKSRESRRPKILVLVDGSASMNLPYLPGSDYDSSRSRASVAAEFTRALIEKLPRRFEKQIFLFSDTLAEISASELAERRPGEGAGIGPANMEPSSRPGVKSPRASSMPSLSEGGREARAGSPRSALGLALTEASRRVGNAPGAVVLISDGASSYGPDPSRVARALSLPVYGVVAAEEGRFRDIEVSEVLSPSSGFVGSEIPVLVRVKGHGLENLDVPVTISEAGLIVSRGTLKLAGSAHTELLLSLRPAATAGVHFYELRVPAVGGEASTLNNLKRFAVEAVSEKLKITYLEGDLTWDFRFLKRELESDPRLETTFALVSGWKAGSPNVKTVSTSVPAGLGGASVVIVGDGAARYINPGLWRNIEELVFSGGGVLFAGVEGLAQMPASARGLLPVELRRPEKWGPRGFMDVALTAQGLEHPVCEVEKDPALNRESWEEVSPLIGTSAIERAKPGTSVLLRGYSEDVESPVLVAGNFGKGRVLLAGAGGLWRWGFTLPGMGGSKRLYPSLISNAVSWLSESSRESKFEVVPAKWVFESGDDVLFDAREVDEVSSARLEVRDASGRQTLLSVSAAGDEASRALRFGTLRPGVYSYKASASQAGRTLSFQGRFMVDTTGAEDRSLFPDPRLLSYISQASGGTSFRAGQADAGQVDAGQLDKLVREISAFGDKVVVERQVRLWNHPFLFVLFTCLLALEWWLRRRSGLP
jgi:hypothetical protein